MLRPRYFCALCLLRQYNRIVAVSVIYFVSSPDGPKQRLQIGKESGKEQLPNVAIIFTLFKKHKPMFIVLRNLVDVWSQYSFN